jgi:hypothetical protein
MVAAKNDATSFATIDSDDEPDGAAALAASTSRYSERSEVSVTTTLPEVQGVYGNQSLIQAGATPSLRPQTSVAPTLVMPAARVSTATQPRQSTPLPSPSQPLSETRLPSRGSSTLTESRSSVSSGAGEEIRAAAVEPRTGAGQVGLPLADGQAPAQAPADSITQARVSPIAEAAIASSTVDFLPADRPSFSGNRLPGSVQEARVAPLNQGGKGLPTAWDTCWWR